MASRGTLPFGIGWAVLLCGLLPAAATAQDLRWTGDLGVAKAVGGHQEDEFSWGAEGRTALEWGLFPWLALDMGVSGVVLSKGADPSDPQWISQGTGWAGAATAGLVLYPALVTHQAMVGPWVSGEGGYARTGDLWRPAVEARVGWYFPWGRARLGPAVGWFHIFQPDSDPRPEDANLVVVGVRGLLPLTRKSVDGDRDGDGIRDSRDRCPDSPEDRDGFQDEDGCPELDNDHDGIVDAVDRCPLVPEDLDSFEDQDGCPERDNDKDGFLDPKDLCPNEPEDKDSFEDGDGCPDLDNDKDGIPDTQDLCPNEPETFNDYADGDGCPDRETVRVVGDRIILDERVHFWTNSSVIRKVSYPLLRRLADLLVTHPEYVHIHVEGHADERGPAGFNKDLSERRARAVVEFLVANGIAESRLSYEGFGEDRPMVGAQNERALFENRRVEFRVTREVKQAVFTDEATTTVPQEAKPVDEEREAPKESPKGAGSAPSGAGAQGADPKAALPGAATKPSAPPLPAEDDAPLDLDEPEETPKP